MKKYDDNRISFVYPDDFKLVRAKQKWGQYNLEKKLEKRKTILIVFQFVQDEVYYTIKRNIRNCPFDEFSVGEIFETAIIGQKPGIGLVVNLTDTEQNFIQKRYRYLFSISSGGLYIEIIGEKEFTIDTYMEILESIKVKDTSNQA
jgi:hypothetical protein